MSEVRPGSTIAGRYRLDALVGEGGMSTVWRATDMSLSREVAIKVLLEEVAAQADAVARFRREAHSAAKLNHPNIVQIYDTGVDGAVHYIVMEYLPEPDLKRIIHDWAPLPEQKVIDVAVQCCRALAYAHRNGIVHRDVKPHNILFTTDGRPKLSDFGIAAAMGAGGTAAGDVVLGTAHYVAPEQVQGSPAGPHSDLYSLGCVMYEALTGRTPYQGSSGAEIAAKHLRERPPAPRTLNPSVSPATEFVVKKAMAREVAQRYRSADEMLTDLAKLSGGEELDRTGVLAAPEGATAILQPAAPPGRPPGPAVRSSAGDMEVEPSAPAREPQTPGQPAPVLRPPPPPRRSPWGPVAAVAIALIALIVIVWLAKITFYPGEAGRNVQVPMVKGEPLSRARELLETTDLKVGDISFEEDPMRPEGVVIDQTPREGETVAAGTVVHLVVNRGTELKIVIPVEGMTLYEANEALEKAGLTVGELTEVFHASIPAGRVIKQAIRAGRKVEKGTGIDLTTSKGPEPPTTVTPPPATEPTSVEPDVTVIHDETYSPSARGERRFIVTVTAQGQELGQQIQVVKQDDRGARAAVLNVRLNPNESKQVSVVTEGAAIIEVMQNGRVVFRQEEPAPDISLPADDNS